MREGRGKGERGSESGTRDIHPSSYIASTYRLSMKSNISHMMGRV